jgi:hypothetical protein
MRLFSPRECALAQGTDESAQFGATCFGMARSATGTKQDQRQDLPAIWNFCRGIPNRLAIRMCTSFRIVYARQELEH